MLNSWRGSAKQKKKKKRPPQSTSSKVHFLPMTSRRWECGMQFRVQFAEFLVGSEHVGRLFDGFPRDFENENVMLFGSVAFLNTVHYHVCNSSIRVHSVKRSNETFRFWKKKKCEKSHLLFPRFFLIFPRYYWRDFTHLITSVNEPINVL